MKCKVKLLSASGINHGNNQINSVEIYRLADSVLISVDKYHLPTGAVSTHTPHYLSAEVEPCVADLPGNYHVPCSDLLLLCHSLDYKIG
jgi:hypothetical protein